MADETKKEKQSELSEEQLDEASGGGSLTNESEEPTMTSAADGTSNTLFVGEKQLSPRSRSASKE